MDTFDVNLKCENQDIMGKIERLIEKRAEEIIQLRRKVKIIEWIESSRHTVKWELEEFEIPKSTYYMWRKKYLCEGKKGLERKKPIARSHPRSLPKESVDKILDLRKNYQLGPARITWYLERYHGIRTSKSTVSRTLVRHGVNRLPKTASRRTVHTKRYVIATPGHHVQVDVKFAFFKNHQGKTIKRYQFTAIDDATRVRALKTYQYH